MTKFWCMLIVLRTTAWSYESPIATNPRIYPLPSSQQLRPLRPMTSVELGMVHRHRKTNNNDDETDDYEAGDDEINTIGREQQQHHTRRRSVLSTILSSTTILFGTTNANKPVFALSSADNIIDDQLFDFDKPMNSLTRQVRTSVVRGAQLIDKVDRKWERLSDDLGLGSERNQPKRNVIDAGGNGQSKKVVTSDFKNQNVELDGKFVAALLQECDEAFLACLKSQQSTPAVSKGDLTKQIDEAKQLLRKSFFSSTSITPAEEFNFECYAHFKVFNEILVKNKVVFTPFKKQFESSVGKRLLDLVLQQQPAIIPPSSSVSPSSMSLAKRLQNGLDATDSIATFLQSKGLLTSPWERSIPPDDDIEDFITPFVSSESFVVGADLPYSLALNEDVTLNSQMLLQELGYRLYPSFGRWLVQEGVMQCFSGANGGAKVAVQIDDYYMDPSYNTNPDLFEVKQVLLNIVIQRD